MRGSMPLPSIFGREYRVFGGPYKNRPHGTIGLKMAEELKLPCDIDVPTEDYSVPFDEDALAGLTKAVDHIIKGYPVYVGCMGGIGRTGLMMALLAKAWGIKDPVGYVREHYYPHAVETKDQQHYIANFEVPPKLVWTIRFAKLWDIFQFGDPYLTVGANNLLQKIQTPSKKR